MSSFPRSSEPRTLDCEVVVTRTGMPAMRDRATGELMHPVVGPAIEAERLYVVPSRLSARLRESQTEPLVLLDVGLGAGSNALAAWRVAEAMDAGRRLEIVSFDRSLSALELAIGAEHAAAFGFEGEAGVAARALLDRGRHESARTTWRVIVGELPSVLSDVTADVVFWDPFSPRANPSLWTAGAFSVLRRVCREGTTVHTYSGATAVRSAMLLAGFAVGLGPQTGDNKFGTAGAVTLPDLDQPLDRRWLERLGRSSAPFPGDAPADALERIGLLPQFRGA
jgi:queuine tRNA-ribosyltransferase